MIPAGRLPFLYAAVPAAGSFEVLDLGFVLSWEQVAEVAYHRLLFRFRTPSSLFARTTQCHPEKEYRSGAARPGKNIADVKIHCIAGTTGEITDKADHAILRARAHRNDAAIAV